MKNVPWHSRSRKEAPGATFCKTWPDYLLTIHFWKIEKLWPTSSVSTNHNIYWLTVLPSNNVSYTSILATQTTSFLQKCGVIDSLLIYPPTYFNILEPDRDIDRLKVVFTALYQDIQWLGSINLIMRNEEQYLSQEKGGLLKCCNLLGVQGQNYLSITSLEVFESNLIIQRAQYCRCILKPSYHNDPGLLLST